MGWNVGDEVAIVTRLPGGGATMERGLIESVYANGSFEVRGVGYNKRGYPTGGRSHVVALTDEVRERMERDVHVARLRRRRQHLSVELMVLLAGTFDEKLLDELEGVVARWQSVDGA